MPIIDRWRKTYQAAAGSRGSGRPEEKEVEVQWSGPSAYLWRNAKHRQGSRGSGKHEMRRRRTRLSGGEGVGG